MSAQARRQGRHTHHRTAAGKRIFVAMLCRSKHFIVNGRERRVRKAPAQAAVGFDGCFVGRHREQDRHRDRTAAGFFNKTDLMRHGEKRFEGFVTKIDDLRSVLVRNQAIEQRHLAIDVANGRRRGLSRQKVSERFFAGIEIERLDGMTLLSVKIGEQPSQQCLANAGRGEATMVMELRNDIT